MFRYVSLMEPTPRFHGPAARAVRVTAGIRQAELARRVGISRSHLANVEKGKQPSLAVARKIADELGVTLDAVMYVGLAAA